jgi:signal transduction histidine kinase
LAEQNTKQFIPKSMKQLPNILLVDYLEVNLILLKTICSKLKANFILAYSGFEALEKIRGIELALAIIDVHMHDMSGYELAIKMNNERGDEKVPVILLTANQFSSIDADKGYSSGAIDYIVKPFNHYILKCKINFFLDLFNQKQTIIKNSELLKRTAEELKISIEQQHLLTQHIEKAREQERVAISSELHDDLGQSLTAIKMDLSIIRQNVSDNGVVFKIKKLSALVGDTIKTVQRITSQLRPEIIDDLGLESALEWYTMEYTQRYNIEVLLDIDSTVVFSPEVSLTLFRIMQESLTNIARHAMASTIGIRLFKANGFIHLMISDNGIGITDDQIQSKQAFGILSMKDRASSLGGNIYISRGKESGTEIKLIFPLTINK